VTADEAASLLKRARRILVIGCSGSGKSTLSQALSTRLGSRYISMDREFFWLPGWILRERGEVRRLIAEAVAGESWVMDGTSPGTLDLRLPRADMVVWLRMPRLLCIARVLKRRVLHSGRSRPEMAPGCPEKFGRTETPEIRAALASHGPGVPVVTLCSPAEVRDLLARLDGAL
jgi:adenylate kinase family enzyme